MENTTPHTEETRFIMHPILDGVKDEQRYEKVSGERNKNVFLFSIPNKQQNIQGVKSYYSSQGCEQDADKRE